MIERVRERLIAAGLTTREDFEQHLAYIAADRLHLAAFLFRSNNRLSD